MSTFAGTGVEGNAEGGPSTAQFRRPTGLAMDQANTLYLADTGNHRICTVSTAGVVTTLAGNGTTGFTNATATAAAFSSPAGLVVDNSGNVFVADTDNHCIRRISSQGVVTTFAGSGSAGSTDSTGTAASFNAPRGIALEASGTLLVADTGNNRIRRINNSGVVSTVISTDLNQPVSVIPDGSGNIMVVGQNAHRIYKIATNNSVSNFAGTGTPGFIDGTLTSAQFNSPNCFAPGKNGDWIVADSGNHRIRKIIGNAVTTIAGNGEQGRTDTTGAAAKFNFPRSVVVDANGNVYVTDENNHCIRKLTPNR